MLDIGNISLFISDSHNFDMCRVLELYDTIGLSVLFCHKYESVNKCFIGCSKILYDNKYDLYKSLLDNMFRVDIIIVEVGSNYKNIVSSIRSISNKPIVLIGQELKKYDMNYFDYCYEFIKKDVIFDGSKKNINYFANNYTVISDIKNNWQAKLVDIEKQYVRNKKIDILFKKE
jgi:hypothetical protein